MVFQQQQLQQTVQQLTPRIQQQQQLFNHLQLKFESEKAQFTQAEIAVNELQQFESTHHAALNEVRRCIQERDFIGAEFKKVQEKLQALEQSKLPLNQQQQKLEQQIQHIDRQQTECKQQLEKQQQWFERKHKLDSEIISKQQLFDTQSKLQQDLTPEREHLARL